MIIFKEKAGIISKDSSWVCFHKEYMYTSDTLLGLLKQIIFEWKHDKHIAG